MYDFTYISIPTRGICLKIIWETTHTCRKLRTRLGDTDTAQDALDCYMVIESSVQTLCTYMTTTVGGDTCLYAYNGVSGCTLLVQIPG